MKINYEKTRTIFLSVLFLASLAFQACTDDFLEDSSIPTFDESDVEEAKIAISVNNFMVNSEASTRKEEPSGEEETSSSFENKIDNIWVFQYDDTYALLITPRYYTAQESEDNGIWDVELKRGVKSKIYVVANVDNDSWGSNYQDFLTIDNLLKQALPSPYPIILNTEEEKSIPMQGVSDDVVVTSNTVEIIVTRMYAKIKVKVILDDDLLSLNSAKVSSVGLSSIPWYCRVETLYDATNISQKAQYPDGSYWIGRSLSEKNSDTDDGFDYVFYIPENIQGEIEENSDNNQKTEYAPENATLLTAQISYIEEDTNESRFQDYLVSPGGNNYNNYNVRRNCVYRVTLNIGYPIEPDYQLSANCMVASPYSTISFEPYYREETGGGYKFEDYLNPIGTGSGKQIKAVKILWQTEGCIGDNTNGDLVYFEPLKNEIEQDLHSKIYVTVNQSGNAVIAAYDDDPNDNPDANIIWSWHIWVPNADEPNPTNVANGKLYYTYDWDINGIYGYKDSSGNLTRYSRIPGYTMMNLNLGALRSEPKSDYDKTIFGMNYQWGRKDPFPPMNIGDTGRLTNGGTYQYDNEHVGPLYDNEYQEINITSNEIVNDGKEYLFHTIAGTTIEADPTTYGINYAIAHPTQFMCGALEAGDTDFGQTSSTGYDDSSQYHNNGDWLPTGYNDNKLWGALNPDENQNIKVYPISSSTHLYDDYGEKSIFDPCPYGWRVSPPDQWLGFSDTGLNPKSMSNVNYEDRKYGYGMYLYIQEWMNGPTSYFPTPGPILGNGCGYRQYVCGNYHNATADTNNHVNILHIHESSGSSIYFRIFENEGGHYGFTRKSIGSQVRCVRDSK